MLSRSVQTALLTLVLAAAPACKSDGFIVTILHTNDTHMHFEAPRTDEFSLGGMSRLATLLKTRREQAERSITLDAGDWSEGDWSYNVDLGASALRMFQRMGYDAVVVGNHDYLNGPDEVWKVPREARASFATLGANFDLTEYDGREEFEKTILPSTILERGGIRIGVIGLSTVDYVFKFWLDPVRVMEPIEAATRVAKDLRPNVDLLVVLSHNAFSLNQQLARAVPGVDAVISGHSHEKIGKAVLVQNAGRQVPVVETGSWGRFLGELQMEVNPEKKTARFVGYELLPVLPTLTEDPEIRALVDDFNSRLNGVAGRDVNEVVAETEVPLDHRDSRVPNLGDLAARAYRHATGAEVGIEILALTGNEVPAGPLTVRDLHDVMPHIYSKSTGKEWTVKLWQMRGQDLSLFVNLIYLTNLFPIEETGFFALDGLEVLWAPRGEGSQVPQIREIRVGGQPLNPARRYSVALTDGMLLAFQEVNKKASLGIDLSQITDTGTEGSQAIIQFGIQTQRFTAEMLRTGGRSLTTIPDPVLFPYSVVRLDSTHVQVLIANDGLEELRGARLACKTGVPNDPVRFQTPEQIYTELPSVSVPTIAPLSSIRLTIPWEAVGTKTPFHCRVIASKDGYPGNSSVEVVL